MINPNPFGLVVSSVMSAVLLALVVAFGVMVAGLRDAILNDWADDVPDPLDELDDAPDDEPRRDLLDEAGLHRRIIREGDAARRWLEAHGYMSHGLVWPPVDPEPWRPNPPEDAWPEGGPIVGWTRRLDGIRFRRDDGEVRP